MRFKKRYLVFGWLAMEIASIPAAAQIIDKVVFSVPQKAIHVPLPAEAGISKFAISSNAPFAITAENVIGEFDIRVHKSGVVNGNRFGDNAQMPGLAKSCAAVISPLKTKIYEADRKTAANKGDILSQAVIVEIRYDATVTPVFKVLTQDNAKRTGSVQPCEAKLS